MTGGSMVGLVLLSMAWLFFAGGVVMNVAVLRKRVASGIPLLPGVVGSVAAFFTLPALKHYGIELSWPWFWILLPLVLDLAVFFLSRSARHGSS